MNIKLLLFPLVSLLAIAPLCAQQGVHPAWAYPAPDKDQPVIPASSEPRHLAGSSKTYTPEQIEDLANPPDWYPEDHGPLPAVIGHGTPPNALACGSCHLQSGHGHPESADLAGLPVEYIVRQMAYFKSAVRQEPARMNAIAKAVSDADARQAAEWFAAMKPGGWIKVVEADTIPKSYVSVKGRMRLPLQSGGTEPLGNRIVELPDDPARATARDAHSGFTAYVPKRSIARGAALASSGIGKTVSCFVCHGEGLKGLGEVPRIAGLHPIYIVRQLSNIQTGASAGTATALMKRVVANLTEDDMIALAAYASSLAP